MSCRAIAVVGMLLGLVTAAFFPQTLCAQESAEPAPPKYRRIFVPETELSELVKGLLPVKREEFERRIAEAEKDASAAANSPRITRAIYSARLSGQHLIDGAARLEIVAPGAGTESLSLEPCNLALGKGQWDEMPPRRAVLGIGPRNVLALEVAKAGTVSIPWTRQGRQIEGGAIEFDLALPPAPLQQLQLRLPADVELTARPGLVSRAPATSTEDSGETPWLVELGGSARLNLQVLAKSPTTAAGNDVLVKEQTRYVLTPIDVTADFQWQLDVQGQPLRSVMLRLDPRLAVTSVSVGGQPAAWSIAGDDQRRTLNVEFTQPLAGGNHSLSVHAASEQTLGQPYRLPRITWEDAVWLEGSATIHVPPSLQAAVTNTRACRATKAAPPPAGGESLAFQYHAADAYVEIQTMPLTPRLTAAMGMTIQFEANQISATMRVELTSLAGEAFEVDAVVSNEWILDSLETEPSDVLEDRPVIAQDERTRTMRLKFQRPISQKQPLRLLARARRQQPLTGDLSSDVLWRWFRVSGAIERPAVMSLRSDIASYDLQVTKDLDATRLDPEASSPEELALLDSPPSGTLLRLPPEAAEFQIRLRAGEPRFAATWEVVTACSRNRLRHQVTVRCIPSESGLSRVVLSSRPPPQREIRWRVAGATDASVVAQTRRDTGASGAGSAAEAGWELELSRPLAQPFTIESIWEEPRTPRQPVALFACPSATTQSGVVRVVAEDDSRWSLTARELVALPIMDNGPDRFTATRGHFRYEPGQQASLVIAEADEKPLLPLARLTAAELTTRFASDGSGLSALTLHVENTGLLELPLQLPPSATLQEASVDGRLLDLALAGSQPGEVRIALPERSRHVEVRIAYSTAPQPSGLHVRRWRAELPELSLPAPAIVWQVALPPGVRPVAEAGRDRWAKDAPLRLWGLFLDGAGWAHWLHPWRHRELASPDRRFEPPPAAEAQRTPESATKPGWLTVTRRASWSSAMTIEVYEPQRLALLGLTLTLACAGFVLATGRRWMAFWCLTGVALAALTLVVPLPFAAPVAGALWGVLGGCAGSLLRPAPAQSVPRGGSRVSTTRWLAGASASAVLLLCWIAASGIHAVRAAPPEAPQAGAKQATTQRVVFPTDDDGHPAGEYVYVQEGIYDWLFRSTAMVQSGEPWLLRSAVYEVRWPDPTAGGTLAADVRASLEIETFSADAQITLPFQRKQVLLKPGGARFDGTPLTASWLEDGGGLSFVVPSSGKYRLELEFSAPLKDSGQQPELAMAIPRAPIAFATVSHPASTAAWASAAALGSHGPRPSVGESVWQFELGSAAELALRPNAAEADAQAQQSVEAEHLLWWKVRPGSVVVDAVCKFRPLSGSLREVQLRFDPRLRLLLPLADSPSVARHWVEAGAASTLHVALAEPTREEVTIRPRFLLAESSGVGKIVPPRLEPLAGRIARHWMAVTPGPGLELATMPQPSCITPAQFVQVWGASDVLPLAAFDLTAGSTLPALEFRPEVRRASAVAETIVTCSRRSCRMRFQADFSGLAPHLIQQRVVLPAGWTATQVVLRDGDLPVRSRWFQESDGTVVARLDQPPGHSLRMQIDAVATVTPGQATTFPAVRLLDVDDAGQTLRIARSHDCDVEVTDVKGWLADDASQIGRHQEGLGRLVTNLRSHESTVRRELKLRITPNDPQVTARLVTRFTRPALQGVEVVAVCDLAVTGGKLDALRLEAPPLWSGPWETTPPMNVRTEIVPGQARRLVTLIPDLPLTGKAVWTILAPLRSATGESLRMPDIAPIDWPQTERFVQWPQPAESDASRWNIVGLQAAPLPADLRSGVLADDGYETMAVVAPHFDAVLTAVATPSVQPLVSLAEYRGAWHSGSIHGEVSFLLDVSSLDSCLLEFPPGQRPTFATLDGAPAEIMHEKNTRWRVRPSGLRLPQRLAVGFEGPARLTAGKLVLSGPVLVGLPAKATIWSLAVPPDLIARRSDLTEERELVQLDQDLLRLRATSDLMERATVHDVAGLATEAMAAWLRPWQASALAAAERTRSSLRTLVSDDSTREAAFRDVQAELDGYWQSLSGDQPVAPESGATATPESSGQRRLGSAFQGSQPRVVLELVDPAEVERIQRPVMALVVALLGVVAWFLARWSLLSEWLLPSGPFWLAMIGLALALASPLGAAAALLVLMAVAVAWHIPWSPVSTSRHSSIIGHSRQSSPSAARS